jgi:hypothetical protein
LAIPWLAWLLFISYFVIGTHWPALLHPEIRETVTQLSAFQRSANIVLILVLAGFAFSAAGNFWNEQRIVYLCQCLGTALLLWFVAQTFAAASHTRSAKTLAERAIPFIRPQDQLVSYNVYLNGLPFYLSVERPIWVIWSGRSKIIMQNIYVAQKQPAPAPGFGPVLFTFEEFAKKWKAAKEPLLVFSKQGQISRLLGQSGELPKELTRVGVFILVSNH